MGMYHNRPHVQDIRAMKKRGEKISMLYVSTPEEAAAAAVAGIHILSIEGRFFDAEMRDAAFLKNRHVGFSISMKTDP
jgi:3-methyl-2-oxobutanoate hydroxymethyltransferase